MVNVTTAELMEMEFQIRKLTYPERENLEIEDKFCKLVSKPSIEFECDPHWSK
jgi:hypothetical protein